MNEIIYVCPSCKHEHDETDIMIDEYEIPEYEGEKAIFKCDCCNAQVELEYTNGELEVSLI